jgi:hypothetical protein
VGCKEESVTCFWGCQETRKSTAIKFMELLFAIHAAFQRCWICGVDLEANILEDIPLTGLRGKAFFTD